MTLREMPAMGDRVRLKKTTIIDIPARCLGTVVGNTRPDWTGDIIVSFDDKPHVRYMRRSDLSPVEPSPTPSEIGWRQRQGGSE